MEEFKLAALISVILLIFFTVPTAPQTRSLVIKYKIKRLNNWIDEHPLATTSDHECMDLIQSLRRSVRQFPSDDKRYDYLAKNLDRIIHLPESSAIDMQSLRAALSDPPPQNKSEQYATSKKEA